MILPRTTSEDAYRQLFKDDAVWLPAARELCSRHALDPADLERPTLGSNVVFRAAGHVLKLFPPFWGNDDLVERATLPRLSGLPSPDIVAEGELEGWTYIVMTTVEGTPALEVWKDIPHHQKLELTRDLGRLMRVLHDHPPIPELEIDWNAFLQERINRRPKHHRAEDPWKTWIAERLDEYSEPPFSPVLLNADITEDHLLLSQVDGTWSITGFIDFADAMMGHPFYDFAAPFCSYTFGHPDLTSALLDGYGLSPSDIDRERLTTYCLLHRFGRLSDFLKVHPVSNSSDFSDALWGS
jgi:hygromycin-B 7''-O-kinase